MPSDDSAFGAPASSLSRQLYGALLAGAFVVYAVANAVVPVSAELRADLGLSGSGAALLLAPFAVGFGIGCLVWFAAARNRPPRPLLCLSLLLCAAGSLVLVWASAPEVAVGARFVAGLGAAGFPSVAQAVIANGTTLARRGRLIAGFVAAVVVGSFGGQAAVGVLADLTSVAAALLVVSVAAPLVVATLLWQLLTGPTQPLQPAGATVAVSLLLRRQWPPLLVAFLAFAGYWLMLSELPTVLRESRYGLDAGAAGMVPLLGVAGAVAALATGRAADRWGRRAPLLLTLSMGATALALTIPGAIPLALFAPAYGLFLAAYWGYLPPTSAEVAARAPAAERQAALLALYTAMWLGAALAPAAAPLLGGWSGAAGATVSAWLVAAAITACAFTHHHPRSPAA